MNASSFEGLPVLPYSVTKIIGTIFQRRRRVLLYGPPGVGKSPLVAELACELHSRGMSCHCIGADPGSPGVGLPGAVSRGNGGGEAGWLVEETAPLCSLDASRFRLPLILSVQRLAQVVIQGTLLVDGPGVVRGPCGRELLQGLVAAAQIEAVLLLVSEGDGLRAPPSSRLPMRRAVRASGRSPGNGTGNGRAILPGEQAVMLILGV